MSMIVRATTEADLDTLVALEEKAWKRHEVPALTRSELNMWYAQRSPFFLVAEVDGVISGYYYGIQVEFSIETMDAFVAPSEDGGAVYHKHRHDPHGSSVYGISVASLTPGVGQALNSKVHELLAILDARYFVGFSRMFLFDKYASRLERGNNGILPFDQDALALWYAHESARVARMRPWGDICTKKPSIDLPPLHRADPIMAFHALNVRVGLTRILPNYMHDPSSRNYGAFLVSEAPHQHIS